MSSLKCQVLRGIYETTMICIKVGMVPAIKSHVSLGERLPIVFPIAHCYPLRNLRSLVNSSRIHLYPLQTTPFTYPIDPVTQTAT